MKKKRWILSVKLIKTFSKIVFDLVLCDKNVNDARFNWIARVIFHLYFWWNQTWYWIYVYIYQKNICQLSVRTYNKMRVWMINPSSSFWIIPTYQYITTNVHTFKIINQCILQSYPYNTVHILTTFSSSPSILQKSNHYDSSIYQGCTTYIYIWF